MTNHHRCINGTLPDAEKYSSPVPVIGLYIAAASAVCALLMLYDIVFYGFLKTQRWLPCKWFKLNSVTLSLIGVVAKLTVDLTTSMPSALDQLSKLAGTTSLCIYMCYIYPSVSDMKDSTNMFALSILVVTVFVNMCIQLSTGVIALFFPEHIIILCIMLVLLVILLRVAFFGMNERRDSVGTGKSEFMVGKYETWGKITPKSFLQRLKICFLNNYKVNPQFNACRMDDCGGVGDCSLISLAVFIQAAIRSIILKKEIFCTRGSSDYLWSMGLIVTTQFIFIMIGSFASCFRRWTMLIRLDVSLYEKKLIEEPYCSNPLLKHKLCLVIAVENVYMVIIKLHWSLVILLVTLFYWILSSMRTTFRRVVIMVKYHTSSKEEWISFRRELFSIDTEFKSFLDIMDGLDSSTNDWVKQKSESNMEKLIEESKRKSSGLCNLLSSIIPVHYTIGSFGVAGDSPTYQELTEKVQLPPSRLHPLVVLVRLIEVAIPESPSQDKIVKLFTEAFETLHFIEKHIHTKSGDLKETEIAKALWMAGNFGRLLPVDLRSSDQFRPSVDHAFHVMNCIYERMGEKTYHADSVSATVKQIRDFLENRSYSSAEELGNFMQGLFVYMFNVMLAQLPDAIFIAVSQSPDNEFEERVRQSLKHFSMLQSWDGICKWKPPQGFENCTGLLDPEEPAAPNVVTQCDALVRSNDASTSLNQENSAVQNEGEYLGDNDFQVLAILNDGHDTLSLEKHLVNTEDDGIDEIESI